jgi:hypothetical protein
MMRGVEGQQVLTREKEVAVANFSDDTATSHFTLVFIFSPDYHGFIP